MVAGAKVQELSQATNQLHRPKGIEMLCRLCNGMQLPISSSEPASEVKGLTHLWSLLKVTLIVIKTSPVRETFLEYPKLFVPLRHPDVVGVAGG